MIVALPGHTHLLCVFGTCKNACIIYVGQACVCMWNMHVLGTMYIENAKYIHSENICIVYVQHACPIYVEMYTK